MTFMFDRESTQGKRYALVKARQEPKNSISYAPKVNYNGSLKPVFDILLTLVFAPMALTVVLIFALLIALDGGNPFYCQRRVGRHGRVFRMWKLRSMVVDADNLLKQHLSDDDEARREWDATQKLTNDPRITPIGRIIRKTSIDELPQLWNVLVGHMSWVGPRPIMECQREMYTGESYYRLRPGLTGPWQVSDRHTTEFRERVVYDDAYFRTMSLGTDIGILCRTIFVVIRCTGV